MNGKIKHVAIASLVAIMASGCSAYRGASQGSADTSSGGYSSGGGIGQLTRGRQVSETGQVRTRGFGQSQRSSAPATCAPCGAAPAPKSTYTYTPPKPAAPAPKTQTSQYNQQYYIDRWNKQQAQQKAQQAAQQNTNYAGYGAGTNSNTTYYDYSSAGGKANAPETDVSASNKSIYTGSYQQKTYKPYQPTTYAGGSEATTPGTADYANTAGTSSSADSGATYVVKKGDTVFEIMRQTGVYWKDIISVNNLTPPYAISPGQTLRLK